MQEKQPTTELSNLSNHAVELNQKSDSWNEVIESWNARLAAMNIGLEYWLDEPLEETGMFSPGPEKPLCEIDTYLGYCEIGGKWQLALKETTTEYIPDRDDPQHYPPDPIPSDLYTALLKAPRSIR